IAEELSSIRQELSTLKQDFLAIRAHERAVCVPEPVENPPKAEKEEAPPQSAQGGFFDDSDDEKIALAGNELDNILLSADFTEEIGMDISKDAPETAKTEKAPQEAEAPHNAQGGFFDDSDDEKIALTGNELDNVLISADFIEEVGEDLLEDTLEAAGIEPAPETSEEIAFEIEKVLLYPSTDPEELRRLREEGVEPITPMLEDSSYLEADPAAQQELEAEDIDLSDVVIDEPDLSGQLQENPLQEPVLEAIAFDDMPLNLSDEDHLSVDIETVETSERENAGEEPLEEMLEEAAEQPVAEESSAEDYPVEEAISEEEPAEPAAEEYPVEESLPAGKEPAESAAIPAETVSEVAASGAGPVAKVDAIPSTIRQELKTVLSYMDQLLESLPEEKIEEFAASKYFDTYKKLFSELGLV
ncbi:MAG: hypothetical protein LBF60_09825, partial [Treponema sp.]|nr:hypothetical protein [Treponema sp.]